MTLLFMMNLAIGGSAVGGGGDVFIESKYAIEDGMKPFTAAGMGGVLISD